MRGKVCMEKKEPAWFVDKSNTWQRGGAGRWRWLVCLLSWTLCCRFATSTPLPASPFANFGWKLPRGSSLRSGVGLVTSSLLSGQTQERSASSNTSAFSILSRRLGASNHHHHHDSKSGLFLSPGSLSFESARKEDTGCGTKKTSDSISSTAMRGTAVEPAADTAKGTTAGNEEERLYPSQSSNSPPFQSSASQSSSTAFISLPTSLCGDASPADQQHPPKEDESAHTIPIHELNAALSNAKSIAASSPTELRAQGWALVQNHSHFSLYKRPVKSAEHGVVEYMMTGQCEDVSARTFFLSQVKPSLRQKWDRSVKEMYSAANIDCLVDHRGVHLTDDKDTAYYRAKWPWPLHDRDYALTRRFRVFNEDECIVLVSRSQEKSDYAKKEGVVRVDNYRCHSAFMPPADPSQPLDASSRSHNSTDSTAAIATEEDAVPPPPVQKCRLARPGVRFVTVFCDDQKAPLPSKVTKILTKLAEQIVSESFGRLYAFAKSVEAEEAKKFGNE